jgi:hypothetical protein
MMNHERHEKQSHAAFMSALTTEHFVLQTAANATVSDAAARSSLYVFSLSSSLVAMGFASRSREVFVPFIAIVLPAIFVLGVLTVIRLVDTALENMQCLAGIARIRRYYRTLSPEADLYFAARHGRWPEAHSDPALRLGRLMAFLSTSASMIAFINSVVGGVGIALFAGDRLGADETALAMWLGVALAGALIAAFIAYERWRFRVFERAEPSEEPEEQR